mgnify:CR=1 FL=1
MTVKELQDLLNKANPNAEIQFIHDDKLYPATLYGFVCNDGGNEQTATKVVLFTDDSEKMERDFVIKY